MLSGVCPLPSSHMVESLVGDYSCFYTRKQRSCVSLSFYFCCIIIHEKSFLLLSPNCSTRFFGGGLRWICHAGECRTERWELVQTCDIQGKHRKWSGWGRGGARRKLQSSKQHFDTPMYPLSLWRVVSFQAAKTVAEFTQTSSHS